MFQSIDRIDRDDADQDDAIRRSTIGESAPRVRYLRAVTSCPRVVPDRPLSRRTARRTRGEDSSERRERRDAVHRRQPRSGARVRSSAPNPLARGMRIVREFLAESLSIHLLSIVIIDGSVPPAVFDRDRGRNLNSGCLEPVRISV